MIQRVIRSWSFLRILQLVLGTYILIESFQARQKILIGLGVLFVLIALINLGCTCRCSCMTRDCKCVLNNVNNE